MMLTSEQFEKSRNFLLSQVREIDKAMFLYEFEGGDPEGVIQALRSYQNDDKGFGRALEPDLRADASSVLATTLALQYASKLNSNVRLGLIEDCFDYLKQTYIAENQGWEIIPEAANDAPRAIWWNYEGFQAHWGNPNAEILGYFYAFSEIADPSLTEVLQTRAFTHLLQTSSLLEMHELFCYTRLFVRLPKELQHDIRPTMEKFMDNCVIKRAEDRNGYCAVPLQIVDGPESPFYAKYQDVLAGDLDALILAQGQDGTWSPNWSWGRFEEAWGQAKLEWQGYLTLHNLMTLKAFGRIAS
ncbi:hypothetical protein [Paenibacillus qinlingensis]|uniref:Uncharacterized protein n=1 Tax=Paenibacillus qinlingensis TaxID=1837343 RepID=A0ABU1P002_9BACL|nr:hypothetical protein [Paenibacillus qinlingensis]MDR6552666.1 hypothetical protein [Paenibacillus qinlingensis]